MKLLIKLTFLAILVSCSSSPNTEMDAQRVEDSLYVNYDSLKMALEEMYDQDQGIRHKMDSVGFDSPNVGRYIPEMIRIDSVNKIRIEAILSEYGWLPKSEIGEKASDAIFYIIQHEDSELMQQYFYQLQEMAAKDEAKLTHAAMMEDRLLMRQGKKQKYGTQASGSLRDDNKYAIWPIENPDSVNQLRKNVGFELTVEENARRLNADYDRNEKLPEGND